jgi:hypothetical protein
MGWEDFNLSLMEAFDFSINAHNLILRVFDSASEALDDEWKKYLAGFKSYISKPLDESEAGIAFSERDWEEDFHRQRMQGIGALALDWLMYSLQSALHSAKKYLDASHPVNPAGYKGDSWLSRVSSEYQQRFGIDFAKGPVPFDHIQELVLARNTGIHRTQETLDDYLKKVGKPTFVDTEDQFCVTKNALVTIIKECEDFLKWVVGEIEKLRPAPASASQSATVV